MEETASLHQQSPAVGRWGEGRLAVLWKSSDLRVTDRTVCCCSGPVAALKANAFESVLMRWMNLEPIIQSEVSQNEKDKYCILMHIES